MTLPQRLSLLLVLALFTVGCAATQVGGAANTEAMLSAAEFQVRPAVTQAQKDYINSIAPYKMHMTNQGSQVTYVYADPMKKVLYLGGQKEYAAYQTMAIRQGMDRQEMQTTEASAMANIGGNDLTPWGYESLQMGSED